MVGVGIEPTCAAFQTAANPSQLSDQIMSVEGFEPSASGFVDQRSVSSAELHEQKVWAAGFEPASACSQGKWATTAPHPEKYMESVGIEPTMTDLQDQRLSSLATTPNCQK